MKDRINISTWIDNFLKGRYDKKESFNDDVKTQIEAGWYDWFCKDSSLLRKTQRMGRIIAKLNQGGKVDLVNCYVWFKNNCPLNGPLYDDFRFADLETGEVQMTIQLDCCWNNHRYSVWGRKHPGADFEHDRPLFEADSVRELINWLNSPWEA